MSNMIFIIIILNYKVIYDLIVIIIKCLKTACLGSVSGKSSYKKKHLKKSPKIHMVVYIYLADSLD